jgi:hypothetical protein
MHTAFYVSFNFGTQNGKQIEIFTDIFDSFLNTIVLSLRYFETFWDSTELISAISNEIISIVSYFFCYLAIEKETKFKNSKMYIINFRFCSLSIL